MTSEPHEATPYESFALGFIVGAIQDSGPVARGDFQVEHIAPGRGEVVLLMRDSKRRVRLRLSDLGTERGPERDDSAEIIQRVDSAFSDRSLPATLSRIKR